MHRSKTIRCLDHAVASYGVAALLKLRQSVKRIPDDFAPAVRDLVSDFCAGRFHC
jgi:hypothetical protein